MKRIYQSFILGLLVAFTSLTANAIPAKRGVMSVEQPDGTTVEVKLIGDERAHQYFTADDYLLVSIDGYFYYANVDEAGVPMSSGIRHSNTRSAEAVAYLQNINRGDVKVKLQEALEASRMNESAPQRTAGLFPDSDFPAYGEQRSIVILVEYKDVKMTLSDPHDYFTRMLNEYGFSDYGGTGCAKEYFDEQSGGKFLCDFDLFGPVTLSQNRSYYGGNNWYGNDQRPGEMVAEACQLLDGEIDFSQYDRNGDGYVDNVFVFYAGRGEASGGSADTIWPHSWTLGSAGISQYNRTFDGVIVDRYACSNEYESGRPDGVGTFVHEFSHVIGLPDLYATSYTSAFTPGSWSAMDYGPYNNDGCTPPNYSAFERGALNWMEPIRIQGAMNATLPEITENVAGIIYNDSKPNEYFLFENRQQKGWDAYIPGHGMLIWHVDYNASVWNNNTVNNSASHQYVDIEEADNSKSEYTRSGDSFPGTSNVRSFTDTTTPNMKNWSNQGFNLPITEITETNGIITFKVAGGATEMAEPVIVVVSQEPETITIQWDATEGYDLIATLYMVTEGGDGSHGTPTGLGEFVASNVNCGHSGSYAFGNLEPQMPYRIEAYFRNGLQQSNVTTVDAFTGRPNLSGLRVNALGATAVGETEFTACWEPIAEASDYLLTVYERVWGAPLHEVCGFDDYASKGKLPEGWEASTPSTYSNTAYSGAAIPAIRFGRDADKVETPEFEDGIRGLSFWHRGNNTLQDDKLNVYLKSAEGIWTMYAQVPILTEVGGQTTNFENIPVGYTQARIQFSRSMLKGSVAVDDIDVSYGVTSEDELLEEYNGIHTGDVDSYAVTGLKPETTYIYEVAGTDGELVSRKSQQIVVETKPSTGIENLMGSDLKIKTQPQSIEISGAAAGTIAEVIDLSGRLVTKVLIPSTGSTTIGLPGAGFYLVRVGKSIQKVAIR